MFPPDDGFDLMPNDSAKVIDVEVVDQPPPPGASPPPTKGAGGPPVHPLSALLLLVVDNLWTIPEFAIVNWGITVPLCFVSVLVPTFLIQKVVKKDRPGRALALALLLGVVAAVPTSVTGTPVGLAILAWTGISRLLGRPTPK